MKKIFGFIAPLAALLFFACDPIDNGEENNSSTSGVLEITTSTTMIQANGTDSAVLTVTLDGVEITDGVVFHDASDDSEISLSNNTFTTTVAGSYTIWAEYKIYTTSTDVTIVAVDFEIPELAADSQPSSTSFHKDLFLVQFTGTSCQYCPGMVDILDKLAEDDDYNTRYHRAAIHSYGTTDAAYYSNGSSIANAFGVSGYPYVVLDMYGSTSNYTSYTAFTTLFETAYDRTTCPAGISVNSVYDDNVIVVTVGVKAAISANFRVGLWVLEDGIYSVQTRNSNVGTSGKDYNTHDDCVRYTDCRNSSATYDYTGKTLGYLTAGSEDKYAFSVDISSSWDWDNIHLLAFVTYQSSSGYSTANCVDFLPGETIGYQYE